MKIKSIISRLIVTSLLFTNIGVLAISNEVSAAEVNTHMNRCAEWEQVEYIVTTKNSLNLRKSASKNSKVITKMPTGSFITKISALENGWAKTVYTTPQGKEYIGYAYYNSGYTKRADFKVNNYGSINANRVILRSKGSKSSSSLGYFYKNDKVEVVSEANSNGYYKVKVLKITDKNVKANIGYVHKDYFEKEKL